MGRNKTPRQTMPISIPAHQAILRAAAITGMTLKETMERLIDDYLPDLVARTYIEARPDIDWKTETTTAEISNLLTKDAPWRYTRADAAKTLRGVEEAAKHRRNTT